MDTVKIPAGKKGTAKTNGNEALRMARNEVATMRREVMSKIFDSRRDIDDECGYPKDIQPNQYKYLYDREGLATRAVAIWPQECWTMDPIVEENEEHTETPFEKSVKELVEKNNIWYYLERIDELSGIGRYGVLLMGFDDGGDLETPVAKASKLLFLRPFDESVINVVEVETNPASERYGKPIMYTLSFSNVIDEIGTAKQMRVHWSRVIHVADNRKDSEVYGVPRLQNVFNRIYDIRKILSGSGEMFWKGAFPGYAFEVNPEIGDVEIDEDSLKESVSDYFNGLQRYMSLSGMTVKGLQPQVADPSNHIDSQVKILAMILGIPHRIFIGSEEARLASSQDSTSWNKRLARRQQKYIGPMVIRPFFARLMEIGILPMVESYRIIWPDLGSPSDKDKAEVARSKAEALAKYVAGQVEQIFPPKEFFTLIMGMSEAESQMVVEAAESYLDTIAGREDEEEDLGGETQASLIASRGGRGE
jgi:hypothetical protein